MAKSTLSQTQIQQLVFDDTNDAMKVNIVAAGGAGGIATEATLERVADATESIDTKTPVDPATETKQNTGNASLAAIDASIDSIDSKTPALGQALAVASVPVVLTAAQVSTLTPQIDALTDTQLRATPIQVNDAVNLQGVVKHDAVTFVYNATSDVLSYRVGGAAGTVVSTLTVNYLDSNKEVIVSTVRS